MKTAILALAAVAGTAFAALEEVQFDVNNVTVTAGPGFGMNYTGNITITGDGDSTLEVIGDSMDAASQDFGGAFVLNMMISLVNGKVTGGNLVIEVGTMAMPDFDRYTADVRASSGDSIAKVGNEFAIIGLTFNGLFSDSMFGTEDVSAFTAIQGANQLLLGSFAQFFFNPNAQGVDTDGDLDIRVSTAVPMPAAASLAGLGLIGLAGIRRR